MLLFEVVSFLKITYLSINFWNLVIVMKYAFVLKQSFSISC